jgi:hypothetical protein
VAYSIVFAKGYIIFITHKPYLAGYSFKFLFLPFHPYVWLAITVTLVMSVAAVTLLMFKHVQRDRERFLGIPKALVILLSPLLDQPESQRDFRHSLRLKTIFGLWTLGGIVLSNSYKSSIVAFLIQQSYVYPPRTFADLVNSFYEMRLMEGFSDLAIKDLKEQLHMITGNNQGERMTRNSSREEVLSCHCKVSTSNPIMRIFNVLQYFSVLKAFWMETRHV